MWWCKVKSVGKCWRSEGRTTGDSSQGQGGGGEGGEGNDAVASLDKERRDPGSKKRDTL